MDHASRVLPSVLAAAIRQAPLTPEKVSFAWRQTGGATIARATTVSLAEGVLTVTCLDPRWAREVHRIRHELQRQLELWLGPEVVARIDVAGGTEIRGRRPRRPVSHTRGA
jgi:predicted nucleic acid-binding Zn ribbon protein